MSEQGETAEMRAEVERLTAQATVLRDLSEARQEVIEQQKPIIRRHRLAVHDVLMACMDLGWATDGSERSMVNQVREVVRRWRADRAERDALQQQVEAVRAEMTRIRGLMAWNEDVKQGSNATLDAIEAALEAAQSDRVS